MRGDKNGVKKPETRLNLAPTRAETAKNAH
jgi:hypothetical protein